MKKDCHFWQSFVQLKISIKTGIVRKLAKIDRQEPVAAYFSSAPYSPAITGT